MKFTLPHIVFLCCSLVASAQNVTIFPNGITPATTSTHPRISYDQILALPNPLKGDLAYDLTFNCLRVFNGTKWLHLLSAQDVNQTSNTAWGILGNSSVGSNAITKDNSGNIYITGNFQGTAIFGSNHITTTGDNDVYLAKYSSEGVLIWVKTAGSLAGDISLDCVIDGNGDIVITGYYFDSITFGTTRLTNSGSSDVFIVKYDTNGNVIWAKSSGGTSLDISSAIEVDNLGNIYICGYFNNSITFDGISTFTLISAGLQEGYLAKFDSNGITQWAKAISGSSNQIAKDILVSSTSIFVLGEYENATNFGISCALTSEVSNREIFVAKYSLNGDCQSAIGFGGSGTDLASRLAKDANSNIFVCGSIFGNSTLGPFSLSSYGNSDAFFVKMNNNLSILYAKLLGGPSLDIANDISIDGSGNVFLTGHYTGSMSNGVKTVNSNGTSDVFVSKFTNLGNPIWLQGFGGADFEAGNRLFSGTSIYVVGIFSQTVNFGNILTNTSLNVNAFALRIVE